MFNRATKLRFITRTKDFLLGSRILQVFQPFNKLFGFLYNFNLLTSWVHKHKNDKMLMNDFYKPVRNYDNRLKSFAAIVAHYKLNENPISYLEFGVSTGGSFRWFLKNCTHPGSAFYGFDTFEGLPEDWGVFAKGDMIAPIPEVNDARAHFIKGIFQDTMTGFLAEYGPSLKGKKKVIHMDADLFSATLFALSQLYPYLQKGDIIMFDEFNVYGHEFMAYRLFTECFYVKLRPISAQNNFYHTAFEVE
jgi:O-methyltransferase